MYPFVMMGFRSVTSQIQYMQFNKHNIWLRYLTILLYHTGVISVHYRVSLDLLVLLAICLRNSDIVTTSLAFQIDS
jgi:hypothetical protein